MNFNIFSASMRQVPARAATGIPGNEVGFALCRTPANKVVRGPAATGTPTSVNIPVACPPNSQFFGLHHSHPGGVPTPSPTDRASAARVGAKELCITNDSVTKCHSV